jgi:hypothetical protein
LALVDEDPEMTLRCGERYRVSQSARGTTLVTGCGQRKCPESLDFDEATDAAVGDRGGLEGFEKSKRVIGLALREQDPGEREVCGLARVAGRVVG